MRVMRGAASIVISLLATVLLVVSMVLSITLILLPLGVPLMFLAFRLYGYGVQLMLPRPRDVERNIRKRFGLRPRGSGSGDLKRAGKRAGGAKRDLGKRAHSMKRDGGKPTGRIQGMVHAWSRRAGEALPGRRPRGSGSADLKRAGKRARGATRDLGKRAHGMKKDGGNRTGRLQGLVHAWSRRAGEALPGRRPRGSGSGDLKRAGKPARGATRDLGKRAQGMKRDGGKPTGRLQGNVHAWSRRAGEALPGRRPRGPGSGD
jgi:hypothetical protein